MDFSLKHLAVTTLLLSSLASITTPAFANISAQQGAAIVKTFSNTSVTDFRQFLADVAKSDLGKAANLGPAISAFQGNTTLSAEQQNEIHRLLGLYARVKYGQAATETLKELVAIPTFRKDGVVQHENPEFLKIADKIKSLAEAFNLNFRNIDNRVYEISLEGSGDEVVGIHAHADVVPVTPDNWVLKDGTRLDPFKVTQVGDRMYGRGTEDDKNGIVVALYAMKIIKEEKLPLALQLQAAGRHHRGNHWRRHPLLFRTQPDAQLQPGAGWRLPRSDCRERLWHRHGELHPARGTGQGAEITALTGGLATNQIPSTSVATFASDKPAELAASLLKAATDYAKRNSGNFEVSTQVVGKDVQLTFTGVSAHSSEPESGVNPVARMLGFINGLDGKVTLKHNHITDAARYAADNWGLDYLGKKLGIGFSDAFMGPLTASLTYVGMDEKTLKLAVNLRVPVGKTTEALKTEIAGKLAAWSKKSHIAVAFDYSIDEPMYRNPEGEWVKALLAVASENLGMEHKYGTSAGATSVHDLPNGVQFGLAMPDVKYTGHNDNEFKTVEQFLLDLQIVTEMMGRIGQLPKL